MAIWYTLWSFGIFYGNLVYFVVIWYILWSFCIFCGHFGIHIFPSWCFVTRKQVRFMRIVRIFVSNICYRFSCLVNILHPIFLAAVSMFVQDKVNQLISLHIEKMNFCVYLEKELIFYRDHK
jgi:hypothetical protein